MFNKTPYIIAEVGSNWHTFDDCRESIEQAAKAGADAVKFQLFTSHDLYGVHLEDWAMKKWELPPDWIKPLKLICDANKVDFMCTVFNPAKVLLVDPYVSYHKVASSDCGYEDLIETIYATDKGVIISTGGAVKEEINFITSHDRMFDRVALLYCQPSYPALSRPRLIEICELRHWLSGIGHSGLDAGFSDHTPGIKWAISAAVDFDADVIEKHFRAAHIRDTPDYGHSIDMGDFVAMKYQITCLKYEMESEIKPPPFKRRQLPHGYYRPLPEK